MKSQTVLIGLDGATFSILDPLMERGMMPFLSDFIASGTRAELQSVIPPMTPPAWTSLVTGKNPGSHGIFDFFLKEKDSPHIRFATSQDVHCETVWSMVNRNGRRATTLNFPLMMPPPELQGNVIAGGWMTPRQLRLGCTPESLYDKLKQQPWFDPKEVALEMAHEEKALEGCDIDEYEDWIHFHIRREKQWFEILRYLMRNDPSDLTGIIFDGVDKIQHLCWRFLSPESESAALSETEKKIRDICFDYYIYLDRLLGEIDRLAGTDATVLMASDHGFGVQMETFFVNAWLEQHGHLKWADNQRPQESDSATLGVGQIARHTYLLDWGKTRAFTATPSSCGIHIVLQSPQYPNGVKAEEYGPFRDTLKKELLGQKHPETGKSLIRNIWTREEAFAGPQVDQAPDLTLEIDGGGLISILASDHILKKRRQPMGTHRPEGIFLARGPAIRKGHTAEALSILDVAPAILYSLDLSIPEDLDGQFPAEIIEPAALRKQPLKIAGSTREQSQDSAASNPQKVFDANAEAEMAARLRELGYIE